MTSATPSFKDSALTTAVNHDVLYTHPTTNLDVAKWRSQGFSLVRDFLPYFLIDSAAADLSRLAPTDRADFGGVLFPVKESSALNNLMLHPKLIEAAAELLGVSSSEIRLTQADGWSKVGNSSKTNEYNNQDQRIHVDAHNHIFVVPPKFETPVAVAMIIYLSDYVGGGTALVSRESENDPAYSVGSCLLTPGGATQFPWINDKNSAESWMKLHAPPSVIAFREQLYKREVMVRYSKGDVLFYRHDVWHRGTPVDEGKIRLVVNLSLKNSSADYWPAWNAGWPQSNYDKTQFMEKFLVNSSVLQRTVLWFPGPGHSYWNAATLQIVEDRYKHFGFDISPYREVWDEQQRHNFLSSKRQVDEHIVRSDGANAKSDNWR